MLRKDNSTERIGDIFTPLMWGKFAIDRFSLLPQWLSGKTICDPTMGTGQLLEALIVAGIDAGYKIEDLPIHNLFGCELNEDYRNDAVNYFKKKFDVDMSLNFIRADFLLNDLPFKKKKFDILFGNPPWINFSDLPDYYKELIKPLFLQYDLAENSGTLLLGGSRIELAALVVQKAILDNLSSDGRALFFLPLSLFLNDGVHGRFRRFRKGDNVFALKALLDFNDKEIFQGVATRYGLAEFRKGEDSSYPVFCERIENGKWKPYLATPLGCTLGEDGKVSYDKNLDDCVNVFEFPKNIPPFSIISSGSRLLKGLPRILVEKRSFPRQGINTCGANDIFFFDSCELQGSVTGDDEEICLLSNKSNCTEIPSRFVYPLLTKDCFKNSTDPIVRRKGVKAMSSKNGTVPIVDKNGIESIPEENSTVPFLDVQKWVILPYSSNGKVLSLEEMRNETLLFKYFVKQKPRLSTRKGVMINAYIKRGLWWALLGVGAYNFAPFKIVWEAYGRKEFKPQLFTSPANQNKNSTPLWQANQALQAFIPCWEKDEAIRILKELKKPEVEEYLLSLKMPGTMNWAQPGKIKRLLTEEKN